jgi:hypothetical protein
VGAELDRLGLEEKPPRVGVGEEARSRGGVWTVSAGSTPQPPASRPQANHAERCGTGEKNGVHVEFHDVAILGAIDAWKVIPEGSHETIVAEELKPVLGCVATWFNFNPVRVGPPLSCDPGPVCSGVQGVPRGSITAEKRSRTIWTAGTGFSPEDRIIHEFVYKSVLLSRCDSRKITATGGGAGLLPVNPFRTRTAS